MRNLLFGEWYRWKKNKAFWICLLSAAGMILLVYLTMTAAGQAMGAGGDVLKETGISGMAAQFAGGGLVTMFGMIFLCIWMVSDYTHGAMKNVVGKGYSRMKVFLAKAFVWNGSYPDHESDYILCDIDNRISPHRNARGGQVIFPEPADLFWSPAAFWSCCQQYCHCHL